MACQNVRHRGASPHLRQKRLWGLPPKPTSCTHLPPSWIARLLFGTRSGESPRMGCSTQSRIRRNVATCLFTWVYVLDVPSDGKLQGSLPPWRSDHDSAAAKDGSDKVSFPTCSCFAHPRTRSRNRRGRASPLRKPCPVGRIRSISPLPAADLPNCAALYQAAAWTLSSRPFMRFVPTAFFLACFLQTSGIWAEGLFSFPNGRKAGSVDHVT